MGRKSGLFAYPVPSPDCQFADPDVKIADSLRLVREYSRFAETIGGDWLIATAARPRQSLSDRNLLTRAFA